MRIIIFIICILIGGNFCFASEELSRQATAFYSDNNFDKTVELLLQINEKERSAQDWLLLGNLLDEKGEKDQAVYMYKKAVKVDPKYYKAYYNIGNICLEKQRFNLAIENYTKATKLNQTNPYIYYNLACAYLKLGKNKEAKDALIKAVTLQNNIPEIHYNLAYVYQKLKKPKLAQIYLDNYNKLTDSSL